MSNSNAVAIILGSGILFGSASAVFLAMIGAGGLGAFLGYAGGGQIGMLAAACCIAAWR